MIQGGLEIPKTQCGPKFYEGQIVRHGLFAYRGVVLAIDPKFSLSEEWYQYMARTRPPKDEPWYHVIVNESEHTTYVAERNLECDESGIGIEHPLPVKYFVNFVNGRYIPRRAVRH